MLVLKHVLLRILEAPLGVLHVNVQRDYFMETMANVLKLREKMNVVEMRTVDRVRFATLDLASMHALFLNVLHLQLVLLQFMTSDVHVYLDTQEMGEMFATEFHQIQSNQYRLAVPRMMIAQISQHAETEHVLTLVLRTNRVHQMQIVG